MGEPSTCPWRISNCAANDPERTYIAVIRPASFSVRSRSTEGTAAFDRSTPRKIRPAAVPARTRVTPLSAFDTVHDSATAIGNRRDSLVRRLLPRRVPAYIPPAPHVFDDRCTSRQRNTHSTELRQVRYPWHPWCGRSVTVYQALTKGGHAICRCGFDDRRNDRSLEVPAWMFEPAACDHLRLTATPFVDCQALIELKAVLQTALRADVLQAPHHSLTAPGGADATGQPPIPRLATDPLSSPATPPALSDAAAGHSGTDDSTARPAASQAGRSAARLR